MAFEGERGDLRRMGAVRAAVLMLLGFWLSTPVFGSGKTDLIYLRNGDRITGEIKEMRQAQMRLKTDPMGDVWIKWEDVERIQSDKWIQIELQDGQKFFGRLPLSEEKNVLSVETLKGETAVSMAAVVRAKPIKIDKTFWERLESNLKVGFNYTKASRVGTLNVSADSTYRAEKYQVNAGFNSTVTRTSPGNDSQQGDLNGTLIWYRPNRWFRWGAAGLQRNDELGIDLRTIVSAGLGRFAWQTQKTELYLAAGLAGNREWTVDSAKELNLEGALIFDWTFFRLYTPKSHIKTTAQLYPGISESDRIRGDLLIELRQEFVADLFWDLTFRFNYDSRPPQGAQAKEDFTIVTSLGYNF